MVRARQRPCMATGGGNSKGCLVCVAGQGQILLTVLSRKSSPADEDVWNLCFFYAEANLDGSDDASCDAVVSNILMCSRCGRALLCGFATVDLNCKNVLAEAFQEIVKTIQPISHQLVLRRHCVSPHRWRLDDDSDHSNKTKCNTVKKKKKKTKRTHR